MSYLILPSEGECGRMLFWLLAVLTDHKSSLDSAFLKIVKILFLK